MTPEDIGERYRRIREALATMPREQLFLLQDFVGARIGETWKHSNDDERKRDELVSPIATRLQDLVDMEKRYEAMCAAVATINRGGSRIS